MKEKEKELAISAESAQSGDSKEAETKTEISRLSSGEKENLAAEGKRNKDAEFETLIKGEYREQFSRTVQKIIGKRLKEVKIVKETAEKNSQLIGYLMDRLGIEDGDTQKLERMIEEMAQEKSKPDFKTAEILRKLVEENNYLKKERTKQMHDMKIQSLVGEWKTQAEQTKKTYKEFDLKKELENPEFCRLLRMGVGMKTAYEVVNIDAILDKNSKDAEKMVVDAIRVKGNRPVENGSESMGGILLSSNVSKLNKKQRAELAKRAAKGEKISF